MPFRKMMLTGILVPSFEVANSRVTSMSANETGDVLRKAVFTGSVFSFTDLHHAARPAYPESRDMRNRSFNAIISCTADVFGIGMDVTPFPSGPTRRTWE